MVHVQNCCCAHKTNCFLTFSLSSWSWSSLTLSSLPSTPIMTQQHFLRITGRLPNLRTRGFFSRATRSFVGHRPTRLRPKAEDTSGDRKPRMKSLWNPGYRLPYLQSKPYGMVPKSVTNWPYAEKKLGLTEETLSENHFKRSKNTYPKSEYRT